MTPIDRAALADALASASAETLKADAALALRLAGSHRMRAYFGTTQAPVELRRLAALALAVAAMEEQGLGVTIPDDEKPYNRDVYVRYDFTTVLQASSLPAALAALLKGDQ